MCTLLFWQGASLENTNGVIRGDRKEDTRELANVSLSILVIFKIPGEICGDNRNRNVYGRQPVSSSFLYQGQLPSLYFFLCVYFWIGNKFRWSKIKKILKAESETFYFPSTVAHLPNSQDNHLWLVLTSFVCILTKFLYIVRRNRNICSYFSFFFF